MFTLISQEACLKSGKLDQAKELYERMRTETLSVARRQFKPSILPFTYVHHSLPSLSEIPH